MLPINDDTSRVGEVRAGRWEVSQNPLTSSRPTKNTRKLLLIGSGGALGPALALPSAVRKAPVLGRP